MNSAALPRRGPVIVGYDGSRASEEALAEAFRRADETGATFVHAFEDGRVIAGQGTIGLELAEQVPELETVLIPIGGHFVMDPKDAAFAISQWIKPKKVMPMHYGTSPMLRGTPEEFKAALGNAPVEVIVMQPGDKMTF